MTWFGWCLIALQVFAALATVALIGQPRTPYTPSGAVITVCLSALVVLGLVTVGANT